MYLIPTIDVEAIKNLKYQGDFNQLILGRTDQGQWGVEKIMEVLKRNNAGASFFVDFAEYPKYPKNFQSLSKSILRNGFDVQLHIHPQFCADINRPLMHHYSLEEQIKIIEQCQTFYYQCCDTSAKAFRAGGYGADQNTLIAIAQNQIQIDSSYYFNHPWCKLNNLPLNVPSQINDIIEIPITVFHNRIEYTFVNKPIIKKMREFRKLDLDLNNTETIKKALIALKNVSIPIVILFMHSFSLIKRNVRRTIISMDINKLKRFENTLIHANKLGYKIISLKDILDKTDTINSELSVVPTIETSKPISRAVQNHLKGKLTHYLRGVDYLPYFNRLKR